MGTSGLPDMYTPKHEGRRPEGESVTYDIKYLCNSLTPKIKGIRRVTYLMSPWFEGNIFDVALV